MKIKNIKYVRNNYGASEVNLIFVSSFFDSLQHRFFWHFNNGNNIPMRSPRCDPWYCPCSWVHHVKEMRCKILHCRLTNFRRPETYINTSLLEPAQGFRDLLRSFLILITHKNGWISNRVSWTIWLNVVSCRCSETGY